MRRRVKKVLGRGIRLKCALGKFSDVLLEQIDKQLLKFTRHEVFEQLQLMAKSNGSKVKKSQAPARKLKGISVAKLKSKLKRSELKGKIFISKDDVEVDGERQGYPEAQQGQGVGAIKTCWV